MARWESPQHERTTALDHSMGLQADRTKIAPTGPSEVAEPLCAASLRCAVRCAPLQKAAETVSRALAYLTDRLIWPYCMPLMAERFSELYEEIEEAHEAYRRCAERNAANLILPGLHDHLARLLGNSPLEARDHTPRILGCDFRATNEVYFVQDRLATMRVTQPLAQRWGRNGSSMSKGTVVETARNNLAEVKNSKL